MKAINFLGIMPWHLGMAGAVPEPPTAMEAHALSEKRRASLRDYVAGLEGAFGDPQGLRFTRRLPIKRGRIGPPGTKGNKTARSLLAHSEGRR